MDKELTVLTSNKPKAFNESLEVLSSSEVAGMLGVTVNALNIWRHQGKGPKYLKFSRRAIRYRMQDVLDWMNNSVVDTKA